MDMSKLAPWQRQQRMNIRNAFLAARIEEIMQAKPNYDTFGQQCLDELAQEKRDEIDRDVEEQCKAVERHRIMSKDDALVYLADAVAQYVEVGFPLHCLTGEERGGVPDREHLAKLREALELLGYAKAASRCK